MGTIFVSKAGLDSNAGTSEAAPVKTLFTAFRRAVENDTIQILDSGLYEPGKNSEGGRMLLSESLNFAATEGHIPTFAGTGARDSGAVTLSGFNAVNMGVGKVITFQGITFDDFRSTNNTIVTTDNAVNPPTVQYTDCTFTNMNGSPIFVDPGPATSDVPNLLDRCDIRDGCNDKIIDDIVGTEHIVIQNCIFHNTASHTTQEYISMGDNASADTIIRNCTLLVDRVSGTEVVRMGVVENIIIKNTTTASVSGGPQNVDSNLVGIDAQVSYSNNCVNGSFGNGAGKGAIQDNTGAGATDGGNNITSDPLFIDESSPTGRGGGLKLQSGSPCIGTGKTIAAVTVDFDGSSRFVPYDMGAYQMAAVAFTADGSETFERKFGPKDFSMHATANKLATRGFIDNKDNRQAPFSVTVAGPATIRRRTTPYKNET